MPDNFLDQIRGIIAGINPMVRPSMYYDLQAGRSLELEDMIGVVVRLGEKHEVSTPLTFAMYAALKPYVNGAPDIPQRQSYSRRQASTSDRGPVHSNGGRGSHVCTAINE